MTAYGLMLHHLHDVASAERTSGVRHLPSQGSITASDLDALIARLGRRRFLSAADWAARAVAGGLGEDDLCVTFDDGLRCQYDVALPVLEALGLTAFWFVYSSPLEGVLERLEVYRHFRMTAFPDVDAFYDAFGEALAVGPFASDVARALDGFTPETYLEAFPFYSGRDRLFRYLRDRVLGEERYRTVMEAMMATAAWEPRRRAAGLWLEPAQIRTLAERGHVVGLHSHTHPTVMAGRPADAQHREYARNKTALEKLVGGPVRCMAHPCNSYDATTLDVLAGLGVTLGFRSNAAMRAHGPLEHPRRDVADLRTEPA